MLLSLTTSPPLNIYNIEDSRQPPHYLTFEPLYLKDLPFEVT